MGNIPGVRGLALYPNPNNGRFMLNATALSGKPLNISILNTLGQVVYSRETKPLQGKLDEEINLDGMAKGIYLLRLADASGKASTIKFNIE